MRAGPASWKLGQQAHATHSTFPPPRTRTPMSHAVSQLLSDLLGNPGSSSCNSSLFTSSCQASSAPGRRHKKAQGLPVSRLLLCYQKRPYVSHVWSNWVQHRSVVQSGCRVPRDGGRLVIRMKRARGHRELRRSYSPICMVEHSRWRPPNTSSPPIPPLQTSHPQ